MTRKLSLLFIACLLSACSVFESEPPRVSAAATLGNSAEPSSVDTQRQAAVGVSAEPEQFDSQSAAQPTVNPPSNPSTNPTIYEGTGVLINSPPVREAVLLLGEDVSLNYEQAPLMQVIQDIMEILELDYVIDRPVVGEVTMRTRTPMPRSALLATLESFLASRNSSIVRLTDGRYFITGSETAYKVAPILSSVDSGGVGSGVVIIPLQYTSARDMQNILEPFAEPSSFIRVDSRRNLLMMSGTRLQIDSWQEIISIWDVDVLAGMSVGIFPIEYSEVDDVLLSIKALLDGSNDEASGGLLDLVSVSALDDINSLMVVTPRAHYLEQVGEWIERLDQAPNSGIELDLYKYEVLNRNVGELALLLTKIYGGGTDENDDSGNVAPGMTPQRVSSSNNTVNNQDGGSNGSVRNNGVTSTSYQVGDATVIADEGTNSLLIYATGRDYRKISRVLEQLDVLPTQVLIEASIIEVSLSDGLQYGVTWALENEVGSNNVGEAGLTSATQIVSGLTYTISNLAQTDIRGVVSALAGKSLLNVISSPSVTVLDNYTAEMVAGSSVPYNSGSFVSGGGGSNIITNNISYKDIGVKLSVTPTVNAGGLVTMDVQLSVTDLGIIDDVTGQRIFDDRNFSTNVFVRSGATVVLGGLIKDKGTKRNEGVPFLTSLPIIGALFGSTSNSSSQTELVVLITPTVISSDSELKKISESYRSGIRNLELIDLPE